MTSSRSIGRPRKWTSDAERMRAFRSHQREVRARLVDPGDAPEAVADNARLRERIAQLESERDRLWAQVVRLQEQLRGRLADSAARSPAEVAVPRAERRRREREAAKQQRRSR